MNKGPEDNFFEEPAASYGQPITFERLWALMMENREQMKETDRKIREVSKMVFGQGKSMSEVAEAFFRGALEDMRELAGIKYKHIDRLYRKTENREAEFDLVLFGDTEVIVVEVKHKLRLSDVLEFHTRQLPAFRELYPEYADKKLVGAMAALSINKDAAKKMSRLGYLLLSQSGQKIRVSLPQAG